MLNARGESVRRGKPLKFVADKIFAQEVLDYHHMMWALTRPRYEGQQAA
jgi:hypothetical protein